ncbi:MAG: glycoside hydrolase family 95 protein [Dysgonomonas sp.]|nr:glycoside hydrolase family 95 protein [Dysgonomonas sp.]
MQRFLFLLLLTLLMPLAYSQQNDMKLWYTQPANEWMKSTPIGNGRLGAMIFGGVGSDIIALNEITIWSGAEDSYQENFCGKEILSEIRKEFFNGRVEKGNELTTHFLAGTPHSFGTHLPIGNLKFNFNSDTTNISNYRRELDIRNAITKVSYNIGKTHFQREYFCSNPDDVLVIKYSANTKGALSANMSLNLLREADVVTGDNELSFKGEINPGVRFIGKAKVVIKGGKVSTVNKQLKIDKADQIIVYLDIRSDYKSATYKELCNQTIDKILSKKYDDIKKSHVTDYRELFDRVELSLGNDDNNKLPTDVRWANVKEGKKDTALDALFFQYGRYLLIASSRENSPLPANLQGLWNDNLACNMGWNCDYHLDINTQQNYWPANITNLHECNKPLFDYIKDLSVHGEKTAQKVYGSPGWVAHTVANVWGYTAPGASVNWGLFPTASCWIASHLWEHYRYTQDKEFLKNVAYPILKKNATFFLDYMVEDPNIGYLMSGPSTSPENTFLYNGMHMSISMMPTCDKVLITEIYNACIQSSEILGIDKELKVKLELALSKFPPFKIGKNGGLQEWFEDYDEAHPNHRHTTHLLSLYPYSQITLEKTPQLAKAAQKTLQLRESAEGWEDVEWSRANLICNHARLKDASEAYRSVKLLQKDFTRENLLSISPKGIAGAPYDIFILDGNTAATAGIAEMLLQAHEDYIEFLPALPDEWSFGSFKGLCVPGGAEVSLDWENKKVKQAEVIATADQALNLKIPQYMKDAKITLDGKMVNHINNKILTISMKKGGKLKINN